MRTRQGGTPRCRGHLLVRGPDQAIPAGGVEVAAMSGGGSDRMRPKGRSGEAQGWWRGESAPRGSEVTSFQNVPRRHFVVRPGVPLRLSLVGSALSPAGARLRAIVLSMALRLRGMMCRRAVVRTTRADAATRSGHQRGLATVGAAAPREGGRCSVCWQCLGGPGVAAWLPPK